MPYATQDDLTPSVIPGKTLMELTDDGRTGEIDPAIVTSKLAEASGRIEMSCRTRYKLPLQQTAELTALTVNIAAYLLYSRREMDIPEGIKSNYEDALQILKDVAAEKIGLDQPAAGAQEQTGAGVIAVSRREQTFGGRNMKGFA